MAVYVTGCTHFGHANIIRLANRPFTSVEDMDDTLITRWNSVVRPADTVIHLGDFAYKGSNSAYTYLSKLNGNILRLQGNHDTPGWGWDYHETKDRHGSKVCLMHYPIEEWNGWWRGSFHLHAHTHSPEKISGRRRAHVGVDAWNFTPILLDDVVEMLRNA